MNSFGLISIGLLLGILAAIGVGAVGALVYLARQQRSSMASAKQAMQRVVAANIAATDKLRTEVVMLLQQVDAERMYQASVGMQRSARQLAESVTLLNKIVLASGGDQPQPQQPSYPGYTGGNMDTTDAATAGVFGEDDADRFQAENWFARPSRSYPPVTSQVYNNPNYVPDRTEPQAINTPEPEAAQPVQTLPDITEAFANEFNDDHNGEL